jgi:HlyD family secretion protein
MTKRKWLIVGGIVLLVIIIVVASVVNQGSGDIKVTTTQVAPHSIKSSTLASGQFEYKDHVELRSQVSGQLVAVPVEEGDRVTKGQVVLRIDPKTYQASVDQQTAQVALQKNKIQSAQLDLENIKRQWQRQTKLHNKGLVDDNTYDKITNQYKVAKVTLASAKKSLNLAQAQLDFQKEQLAKTVIRSPLDGIVTELDVKAGESVIPGTSSLPGSTLMKIGDPDKLFAVVNVDEADIAHIALDESAEVTSSAYPNETLSGTVKFVAPSATTMPDQQGQGFEIKIRIKKPKKLAVRPGMTCRAQIFTQNAKSTLTVPVAAILYEQGQGKSNSLFSTGGAYVFVVKNGKAKKVPVKLGISSDLRQQVTAGLAKGDTVVTGPFSALHGLHDGDAVDIDSSAPEPAPVAHSG